MIITIRVSRTTLTFPFSLEKEWRFQFFPLHLPSQEVWFSYYNGKKIDIWNLYSESVNRLLYKWIPSWKIIVWRLFLFIIYKKSFIIHTKTNVSRLWLAESSAVNPKQYIGKSVITVQKFAITRNQSNKITIACLNISLHIINM